MKTTLTCLKHVLLTNIKITYTLQTLFDILIDLCFRFNKLAKKDCYLSGLWAMDSLNNFFMV